MNLGLSKKVIFSYFIFINFIQPIRSAELLKINNDKNRSFSQQKLTTLLRNKSASYSLLSNNFKKIFFEKHFLEKKSDSLLAELNKKQEELEIQSDKQYEINNVVYAEGNVSVLFKGKLLKADNLIYDRLNKKVTATGNIVLILENQIFKISKLEYSFINEKGYLLNVTGSINTNTLMEDLSSNFSLLDSKRIESLQTFKKKKVLYTPNEVNNWIFFADKITIDGEQWKSKKAVFNYIN